MSENKCPCCGESISEFEDSGFWECDHCPFQCALSDLPRIAAAMELAKAYVAEDEKRRKYMAYRGRPSTEIRRVLEVWK